MPAELRLASSYKPLPPQKAFRSSPAKIRGYGGAMGGGKSRAICEEAFDLALEFPGLVTLVVRLKHTAITNTTKKTMRDEVIPPQLLQHCRKKESGGEDYVTLPNGSTFHFVGLDDPVRWFSSEVGLLVFDEAHEIAERDVVTLITRLRQRNAPLRVIVAFNPADPGHWLQHWFFLGAVPTAFGYRKDALIPRDAVAPIGDCEFVFAKATDNPYLPDGYVDQQLGGLPAHLRRRYLEGLWEFVAGSSFFDVDALGWHQERLEKPRWSGGTAGATSPESPKDKVRFQPSTRGGPLQIWAPPVRERWDDELGKVRPAHRYVIGVDTAGGGEKGDWHAIQVVDVEDFAQVAELQVRGDPDLLAVEAYRLGRIYNDALIAPETTGGWGHGLLRSLERLHYRRIYTRRVEDRLAKRFTDKLGWDTTIKSRAVMLDTLEQALREREFVLRGERTLMELGTFVWPEKKQEQMGPYRGVPSAQPGCHDDLVMALAIAVYLASSMPRQLRRLRPQPHQPSVSSLTGY